ncbi:unnamed protein product [Paramecium octaurelia]|uniref:Uncharacterized protein n=1 Tax=Paramecium octaurelia TaxID=43137 RepID=A0A8S1XDW1_PAROT|nr:unnamed protein product [Paramecium octaurelia]
MHTNVLNFNEVYKNLGEENATNQLHKIIGKRITPSLQRDGSLWQYLISKFQSLLFYEIRCAKAYSKFLFVIYKMNQSKRGIKRIKTVLEYKCSTPIIVIQNSEHTDRTQNFKGVQLIIQTINIIGQIKKNLQQQESKLKY